MKCPTCGKELVVSKKDPSYALCYPCKKKYKIPKKYLKPEEPEIEEEEEEEIPYQPAVKPTALPKIEDDYRYGYDDDDDDDDDDDYDDDYDDDDDDYDDDYDDRRSKKSRPKKKSKKKKKKRGFGFFKFILILLLLVFLAAGAVCAAYALDVLPSPLENIVISLYEKVTGNDSSSEDGTVYDPSAYSEGDNMVLSASFEEFIQYMQDSGTVMGEPSEAYPEVIGAENGCKFIDSNVEFYMLDVNSERYAEASSTNQIGGMEVAAINGPFILIFDTEDQSNDIKTVFMNYVAQ